MSILDIDIQKIIMVRSKHVMF